MTKIALISGITVVLWAALFASTFKYSFYWDDFHLIRNYSTGEILSTFHGWNDPDTVETPAYRPLATILFDFQGTIFRDNIIEHRIFMAFLMFTLLCSLGLVFAEMGFSLSQISLLFLLFASSRVFASLILWITAGSLIFSYILSAFSAYFFILWMKRKRTIFLLSMLFFTGASLLTREEIYVFAAVLPVMWFSLPEKRKDWPKLAAAFFSILFISIIHFYLRTKFTPEAPPPRFNYSTWIGFLTSIKSSWLPGGLTAIGTTDNLIRFAWSAFLTLLFAAFIRVARFPVLKAFFGACFCGILLCLPSLGKARTFGIALPSIAFFSAVCIASAELINQINRWYVSTKWIRTVTVAVIIFGFAVGAGGGLKRSFYVAEALDDKCARKVEGDADNLLDRNSRHVTIPSARRQAGMAKLNELGINTFEDVEKLHNDLAEFPDRYQKSKKLNNNLFLPKYDYLSF